MRRNANKWALPFAAENRRKMPKAEVVLWVRLRKWRTLGIRVRRQHTVGEYIVDFAVVSARVIVECDGSSHDLRQPEDLARDADLAQQGWRVLRFHNLDILQNPDSIVDVIYDAVSSRLT